jgi:hypothetical protein
MMYAIEAGHVALLNPDTAINAIGMIDNARNIIAFPPIRSVKYPLGICVMSVDTPPPIEKKMPTAAFVKPKLLVR